MGVLLSVISCLTLVAVKVHSLLVSNFDNFIAMCLGVSLFGFISFGTLWTSYLWKSVSFPMLEKFSAIISLSTVYVPSSNLFLFSFWDSFNTYIGPLDGVP